jgi:predicted DCC family thiol-disulfide oxidoreductase YuxK
MPDRRKRGETLYVVYDAECALCAGAVRQLAAVRGARAELRFVPLQALEAKADGMRETVAPEPNGWPDRLTRLDPEALRAQMHVVQADGAVFAGAEAVVRIMRELPGWRFLSRLYRVPGLGRAADAAYRYVARRRYDWFGKADEGCAAGACALHGSAGGAGTSRPRPQSTGEMEER